MSQRPINYSVLFFVSILSLFLFLITFSSAAKPVVSNINGLLIVYPTNDYVTQYSGYEFHVHAINASNGILINTTLLSCQLHTYLSNGTELFEGNFNKNGNFIDMYVNLTPGNFTVLGTMVWHVYCTYDSLGGIADGSFEVLSANQGNSMFLLILIYSLAAIFLISSLVVDEPFFVYASGLFFILAAVFIIIYGIDTMNNTTTKSIGYISLGVGFLFTLGAYLYNNYSNKDEADED